MLNAYIVDVWSTSDYFYYLLPYGIILAKIVFKKNLYEADKVEIAKDALASRQRVRCSV